MADATVAAATAAIDGQIAWAEASPSNWWPCVLFSSWVALSDWKLWSAPGSDEPVAAGEVVVVFLENLEVRVIAKDATRPWEDGARVARPPDDGALRPRSATPARKSRPGGPDP